MVCSRFNVRMLVSPQWWDASDRPRYEAILARSGSVMPPSIKLNNSFIRCVFVLAFRHLPARSERRARRARNSKINEPWSYGNLDRLRNATWLSAFSPAAIEKFTADAVQVGRIGQILVPLGKSNAAFNDLKPGIEFTRRQINFAGKQAEKGMRNITRCWPQMIVKTGFDQS